MLFQDSYSHNFVRMEYHTPIGASRPPTITNKVSKNKGQDTPSRIVNSASSIIMPALAGVPQNGVSLLDGQELLGGLRFLGLRNPVGVVLQRQPPVGGLQLLLACARLYPHHLVVPPAWNIYFLKNFK